MWAGLALVDTIVAEAPVAGITDIAAPETVVGPRIALDTKFSAFHSVLRIISRQRLSALSSTWYGPRGDIAACSQHMRPPHRTLTLFASFFPLSPGIIAEAEPVAAAFAGSVAVKANVPLTVGADRAVIMQFIFDMRFVAA